MKKISLLFLVLALLFGMGITNLAWAQVKIYQPITFPKTVFISSQVYVGNLGGVQGADQLCQRLATAAGLTGTYKAWLSTQSDTPVSRFTHNTGPYKLRNGVVIANSWKELMTGKLLNQINIDESGRLVAPIPYDPYGPIYVWTGMQPKTLAHGSISLTDLSNTSINSGARTNDCVRWTSSSLRLPYNPAYEAIGIVGQVWLSQPPSGAHFTAWTCGGNITCDRPSGHIYCFEQ
jgi:hypothetical protein